MKTMIKCLYGKSDGVYVVRYGRRTKLSDCKTRIDIYEERKRLPYLSGGVVKKFSSPVPGTRQRPLKCGLCYFSLILKYIKHSFCILGDYVLKY